MNALKKNWVDKFAGPVLGIIALVTYWITLSSGAYPGESANLIVQYTEITPIMLPSHPLWACLVLLASKIPIGGLANRINFLSMICGSLSIWFLYEIMAGAVLSAIKVDKKNKSKAIAAARLAGMASAIFFAFSIPFWTVSNRAHTASFDILLLLTSIRLISLYAKTGFNRFVFIFAFIYGLGIVEFATFIILVPLFGLGLMFFMWKNDHLDIRNITKIIIFALFGLSLYFITAWLFYASKGYELSGYSGYFQVVWQLWREQYLLITRSLPQYGWLIILIVTAIPWFTCLQVACKALNDERDFGYYLLHVIITGLGVCVLLNADFTELRSGRLLVTPYLMAASMFGYSLAYWFLLPASLWNNNDNHIKQWLGKWLGTIIILPMLTLLFITPFKNFVKTDARSSYFINQYAMKILKCMNASPDKHSFRKSSQTWLITDGILDNHLLLTAKDMQISLHILNLRAGRNNIYMNYVASFFNKPKFKNLAHIGMLPLLQEWFKENNNTGNKIAVLWPSDLWLGSGFTIVPYKLIFLGYKNTNFIKSSNLFSTHESFWKEMDPLIEDIDKKLKQDSFKSNPLFPYLKYLQRHTAMVANNLGVLLENLNDEKEAFRSYTKAREIDNDNISALLNISVMIDKGFITNKTKDIKKDLNELIANLNGKYHVWALSRYYGYVRMPNAFAQLGWIWALSGQPGMAISGLKQAIKLLPEGSRNKIKQTMANIYLSQKQDSESESLYYELLAENPYNGDALLGMARISIRKGNFKKAGEFLTKAEKSDLSKSVIALEWASMYFSAGNTGQARIVLEELVEVEPDLLRAWVLLAGILVQQNETHTLKNCLNKIKALEGNRVGYFTLIINAQSAVMVNDLVNARKYLKEALDIKPDSSQVLEWLLRLDIAQGRKNDAESHSLNLLRLDANNAFGNYVAGSLQIAKGKYDLAEDSFRRSLAVRKTPEVLNDLAWLLYKRFSYIEAEKLARNAIRINNEMYQAWDTLGVILMKTDRMDEAEQAIEKSLSISRNRLSAFLHMAEIHIAKGHKGKAREIVNMLIKKQNKLSIADQEELDKIKKITDKT